MYLKHSVQVIIEIMQTEEGGYQRCYEQTRTEKKVFRRLGCTKTIHAIERQDKSQALYCRPMFLKME